MNSIACLHTYVCLSDSWFESECGKDVYVLGDEYFAKLTIFYYVLWVKFLEMIDLYMLNRNGWDNRESATTVYYKCSEVIDYVLKLNLWI